MKNILLLLILVPLIGASQTFKLSILNGYGSGLYKAGDTVHVFAKEELMNESFEIWEGDTSVLLDPEEWHGILRMPAKNIQLTAVFNTLAAGVKLNFEILQGLNIKKPIYYYFPDKNQKTKALVWLYHGTGGDYNSFASKIEGQAIIKKLIANGYAVAMTECDESTFNKDINKDGNIRWDYTMTPDSTSSDVTNQLMFRDTFINRGYMNENLPELSLGFSAGGAFSLFNGWLMGLQRGVSYCSQGTFGAANKSNMPSLFFQSFDDNHPDIGKTGNDTAYQNYTKMINRGICAEFFTFYPWPCYPEYFKRIKGIDSMKSYGIFEELKSMKALSVKNYGLLSPDQIKTKISLNPSNYPNLISLSTEQAEQLDGQILVLLTFHAYHSHFSGKLLRFYEDACGSITDVKNAIPIHSAIEMHPNPTSDKLMINIQHLSDDKFELKLIDLSGTLILKQMIYKNQKEYLTLDVNRIPPGIYLLGFRGNKGYINYNKVIIK